VIETWSRGVPDEGMPEALLVETLRRVQRHPWWRARAELALLALRNHDIKPPAMVLDAGCGWGVNLEKLEAAGYRVTGLDISRRILQLIDSPKRSLVEADLTRDFGPPAFRFGAILALDVIEHLDDDHAAVQRLARLLAPGGLMIVSVPALPELYSHFDRIQGHRRRYVPETLRQAFQNSGLNIVRIFWWGAWMVPILRRRVAAVVNGKSYADYLRLPPWPGPLLMRGLFSWEKQRALEGRLRSGTSLFAIATTEANSGAAAKVQ
jgi:SAM-dependent methyltransferase